VIGATETTERRPPDGASNPTPGASRAASPLIAVQGDDDLVCVDDTCVPADAAT
jgi:hypothetical protein